MVPQSHQHRHHISILVLLDREHVQHGAQPQLQPHTHSGRDSDTPPVSHIISKNALIVRIMEMSQMTLVYIL